MPMYHLVFKERPDSPVRSVSFYGESPAEALELAKRQDGPAEFWIETQFVCTLSRAGEAGEIWVISADRIEYGKPQTIESPARAARIA